MRVDNGILVVELEHTYGYDCHFGPAFIIDGWSSLARLDQSASHAKLKS